MTKTVRKTEIDSSIDHFIDTIWSQKGLAKLTLAAYQQDLKQFSAWLEVSNKSLRLASQIDIQSYLAYRFESGSSARSNARMLSTLKQYYRHLVRSGERRDNPGALISAPKIQQLLPDTLTEQSVNRLLDAPDIDSGYGLRDRCMLEVMYSSGLRVSELVSLLVGQINLCLLYTSDAADE